MAEKIIKNYWLKIDGRSLKFNIPKEVKLESDHSYPIALMVDVVSETFPTNHDGTHDQIFTAKGCGQIKVYEDGKKKTVMLHVDKRKNSKLLHDQLFHLGYDYETVMPIIRHLFEPYIVDLIEKYKQGEIE